MNKNTPQQNVEHPAQQALTALAEGGVEFDIQALLRSAPASPLSKEAAVLILFGVLDNSPSTGEFEGCPENVGADLDVLLLVRAATRRPHRRAARGGRRNRARPRRRAGARAATHLAATHQRLHGHPRHRLVEQPRVRQCGRP